MTLKTLTKIATAQYYKNRTLVYHIVKIVIISSYQPNYAPVFLLFYFPILLWCKIPLYTKALILYLVRWLVMQLFRARFSQRPSRQSLARVEGLCLGSVLDLPDFAQLGSFLGFRSQANAVRIAGRLFLRYHKNFHCDLNFVFWGLIKLLTGYNVQLQLVCGCLKTT